MRHRTVDGIAQVTRAMPSLLPSGSVAVVFVRCCSLSYRRFVCALINAVPFRQHKQEALEIAIGNEDHAAIAALIAAKADVNQVCEQLSVNLCVAQILRFHAWLTAHPFLSFFCASTLCCSQVPAGEEPPLTLAVRLGKLGVVRRLLAARANPNAPTQVNELEFVRRSEAMWRLGSVTRDLIAKSPNKVDFEWLEASFAVP